MKFGPEWIIGGLVIVVLFSGAIWGVIRGKKKDANQS